jgi:hypothetical protein
VTFLASDQEIVSQQAMATCEVRLAASSVVWSVGKKEVTSTALEVLISIEE